MVTEGCIFKTAKSQLFGCLVAFGNANDLSSGCSETIAIVFTVLK